MKKINLSLLLILCSIFFFNSCKKEEDFQLSEMNKTRESLNCPSCTPISSPKVILSGFGAMCGAPVTSSVSFSNSGEIAGFHKPCAMVTGVIGNDNIRRLQFYNPGSGLKLRVTVYQDNDFKGYSRSFELDKMGYTDETLVGKIMSRRPLRYWSNNVSSVKVEFIK